MTETAGSLTTLPRGWARSTVGNITDSIPLTGKKLKQRQYDEEGLLPVIDQGQNFIGGYTDLVELRIKVDKPVIIFGDHTKAIKFVDFDFVPGADGVKALEPSDVFFPKLFYYFLQAIKLPEKGYARHYQFLEKSSIPIPPIHEQFRIATKIDELFSFLDAGVESLRKVQAQLKRYRQAVLKYAFEGKLTEELQQTAQESLKVRLEAVTNLITKGESPHWQGFDYVEQGITFIRSENVLWGEVNLADAARIPQEFHEKLRRSQIKGGDVLVNLVGASIGRCGLVPPLIERANINQAVALVRTNERLLPSYLMYVILSPQVQEALRKSKVETARPNISLQDLRQLIVPLPSLPEQIRVVNEIEKRFSITEKAKELVNSDLKQADRLRQSILKFGFEGKLVPQDPADEPTSKLLERIKAERFNNRKSEIDNQMELSRYVK